MESISEWRSQQGPRLESIVDKGLSESGGKVLAILINTLLGGHSRNVNNWVVRCLSARLGGEGGSINDQNKSSRVFHCLRSDGFQQEIEWKSPKSKPQTSVFQDFVYRVTITHGLSCALRPSGKQQAWWESFRPSCNRAGAVTEKKKSKNKTRYLPV